MTFLGFLQRKLSMLRMLLSRFITKIIVQVLSSSDSWSILRIGDYFIKTNQKRRRHHLHQQTNADDNVSDSMEVHNNDELTGENENSISIDNVEDFDMLDDICGNQLLFSLMPQIENDLREKAQPIIEFGQ